MPNAYSHALHHNQENEDPKLVIVNSSIELQRNNDNLCDTNQPNAHCMNLDGFTAF
jgi:hypothetical protein